MSDMSATPASTGAKPAPTPTPMAASGPDEFTQLQMTMAHLFGHPRLRHIAETMNQESERDPQQIFTDHGVALPNNATVRVSGTQSDRGPDFVICVSSPEHTHCVSFTLPHIHF